MDAIHILILIAFDINCVYIKDVQRTSVLSGVLWKKLKISITIKCDYLWNSERTSKIDHIAIRRRMHRAIAYGTFLLID